MCFVYEDGVSLVYLAVLGSPTHAVETLHGTRSTVPDVEIDDFPTE